MKFDEFLFKLKRKYINYKTKKKLKYISNDYIEYNPNVDYSKYIKYFKAISLEQSSYCNRVCSFCPNSYIDRRSFENIMNIKIFKSIINDLKKFNFNGEIWWGGI